MGCAHCVRSIEEALGAIGAEVHACEVGRVDIRFDGSIAALREAVEGCGFDVSAITEA